ncbi:MAG: hypothetical protein H0U52_00795 [Chloroflexi bacterium]|nr:hypothetical protein [Chloroflexota bacterium]
MRAAFGFVFAILVVFGGCYSGPDASDFVAILDELQVPAGWKAAMDQVRGPDQQDRCDPVITKTMCPGASRSFLISANPSEAYAQARSVVDTAGFTVTEEFGPACDRTDGPACQLFATRDDVRVRISVFRSAAEAGLDGVGPGGSAAVITVERSISAG